MSLSRKPASHRVLVIDDNLAIHEDYRKIFNVDSATSDLEAARAGLFDDVSAAPLPVEFELEFASQGEAGCELARAAVVADRPFAVAFVDMRMPPGWDGTRTIEELWRIDPHVQVVLATAYSDQSWDEVLQRIGGTHKLLILRKPFENIEVWQLAYSLAQKWRAERASRQREDRLEQEVTARTAQFERSNEQLHFEMAARQQVSAERLVLERRLLESQKMESLGVVAGGIAHDFNNLLTAVMGNASLLRFEISGSVVGNECIDNIEKASMTAAGLCHQMLAFAGKGHLQLCDVDFNSLICEMRELLQSAVGKKVTLIVKPVTEPQIVHADEAQLKQVVMNLVGNAADSFGEKAGQITVAMETVECDRAVLVDFYRAPDVPPGRFVKLTVSDSGCGMTPEVKARAFDPFFSTKFIGRGLGLASVLGIVRSHGGAVNITSEVGLGTAFTVLIPQVVGKVMSLPEAALRATTQSSSNRILLVDDEDLIRTSTHRILERLGYEPTIAGNGREALAIFEQCNGDFALLVLDVAMPELSGLEVLREIRRLGSNVPVVLTSGYNSDSVGPDLNEGNHVRFLAKPYEVESLRDLVVGLLGPPL